MTAEAPSAFCESVPSLQRAWDSTSLTAILSCPKRYEYEIIRGFRGSSVDLEFGGFMASALERYQKERLAGKSREGALLPALRWLLEDTWNEDGSQWGGRWEAQWKCAGTEKYVNARGNRAKCPYAHAKIWLDGEAPDVCGECGSAILRQTNYLPDDAKKHRVNLIRALIWYVEDQPEQLDDGLRPYAFPDGTPAVELSFRLALPKQTPDGEPYLLCGHIDYIGQMGDDLYVVDNKTTGAALGGYYFNGFAPSIQFDTYDLAVNMLYPELPVVGVMIDAVQVLTDDVRTGRREFRKTEALRVEHLETLHWAISQAEGFAKEGFWPRNKANCRMCLFKSVCTSEPEDREDRLREEFTVRHWNPLEER